MKLQVAVTLVCLGLLLPRAVGAQDVVEYYGLDAIGSVRVIFDSTGAMVGRHDYGPFGEQLAASRFGTKVYAQLFRDGESGQDHAAARMYPTRTGRFNGPDAVYSGLEQPQLWNRYSYAANNPLSLIDPSGLVTQSVNCGLGTYWCPGQIQNGKDGDKYFDPNAYGYRGGEEGARAEAGWALGVADAWASLATRLERERGERKQTGSVTTEITGYRCEDPSCAGADLGPLAVRTNALKLAADALRRAAPAVRQQAEAMKRYAEKAAQYQWHHVVPKYLGGAKDGVQVLINSAYHQAITNAFRAMHPYGQAAPSGHRLAQIMDAVYRQYPIPKGAPIRPR